MSFSIGIVGLPNVGKSTLFKALTRKPVDIGPYPFTTIHPNVGIVQVPDKRLEKIAETVKPEKITPTIIEFIDIAGLIRGSHKGEGLGNQFLAQIRNCHAVLQVIRAFKNAKVENVAGQIDPADDIETIKTEFELKDMELEEKKLSSSAEPCNSKARNEMKTKFSASALAKAQASQEEISLLAKKPVVYLLNIDGKTDYRKPQIEHLAINLKEEEELFELSETEKKELGIESQLDRLILACYNILDLITFYTIAGGTEARAWTLKRGSDILEAGGKVHTDFREKFIRAEAIGWEKLVESGSWKEAREKGLIQTIGKDYIVRDGEVIEFKI